MNDKKVIELKTEKITEQKLQNKEKPVKLQTNPILQKMLSINESSAKTKFKLKDLFR